MFVQEQMLNLR